jgi:hypothetical protein
MNAYCKDIIVKHAMHIFQNLTFRPMSAVSPEDQLKIKEVLLMIYRDAAQTDKERELREYALDLFRDTHGVIMGRVKDSKNLQDEID